jgi:L-lysine exporter family protein LysE/ArgO
MYVLIGLVIGFVAAIPLGPVNVFIISQTMKRGFFHGFMGGITSAVLDMVYCLVAILGLSLVTFNLNKWLPLIKVVAAAILFVLGMRLYGQSKAAHEFKEPKNMPSFSPRPMFGVVLLYVSNPSLYAFWLGVAGLVTSHYWVSEQGTSPVLFAASCGLGAILWSFILTRYVAKYHHQFSVKTFRRIFLALAIILFAFSAYTILSIFVTFKPTVKLPI